MASNPSETPQTTASEDLPLVLAPLEAELEVVGARFHEILADVSVYSRDMVDQAGSFKGKRLRPALTCLAARIAGAGVTSDVATVAAVVELIHTATLVHDDILDGASVRRRDATLNARWGEQTAVLVGDILFSKAYRAAAHLDDPFASRYLSEIVGEVLEGEIHQDLVARDPSLTEDGYRQIIRGKTAALYESALKVGAHYGGGDDHVQDALARFGHHLGMAFQIVDDRLDVAGEEARVGKTLGTDLSEGKTTLPVICWLRGLTDDEAAAARALLERAWDDPAAADQVCGQLAASGALEQADAAARQEISAALALLESIPPSEDRALLERLAEFVIRRRR